jgi:hypothetical protein
MRASQCPLHQGIASTDRPVPTFQRPKSTFQITPSYNGRRTLHHHGYGRLEVPGGHGHGEAGPAAAVDDAINITRIEEVAEHDLGTGGARREKSRAYSNAAVDFLDVVHVEGPDRGAVDHGSGDDVKSRAVALTHDRLPREQAC